ncbi:hypothetical protein GX48_05653 [Paracoccidioides brasiliensis]|nr:hypothetical protein GX48_05653 [Paracoccidioides brasiliensis]
MSTSMAVLSFGFNCWSAAHLRIAAAAVFVVVLVSSALLLVLRKQNLKQDSAIYTYLKFFYANFIKPHDFHGEGGQQLALESFYKTQAAVYDASRKRLLRGREDMLGLLAAQLKYKKEKGQSLLRKPIWVDIGGGTGYNIEAMAAFLPVESFFYHIYLVDLSPSLCEIARQRFARLGWKNVSVVCQDAREFRLPNVIRDELQNSKLISHSENGKADLITLSYSLSMIPDFYNVVDSLTSLLSSFGTIGACDFYVQSIVDLTCRNYTGGVFNRHVNWVGRAFWRALFDADRVGLDAARRDYLEYRFGTMLSASGRNYLLGGIPYYIFIGCQKEIYASQLHPGSKEVLEKLNAVYTESPYLSATNHRYEPSKEMKRQTAEIRSKAYESAVVNLSANLPLPSSFYQNHHWRIYYNDLLNKHTQFGNEYIYAFTWEDPRVDYRLLNISSDDVILAVTSAGDNVLDYLQYNPRKVHAVDLNPTQNHLLELKVASFTALGYRDFWKIFGEGKHSDFRDLLISHLSPHLSSQAFQYWLDHASAISSPSGVGLYETGGSRYALKMVRYLFTIFGLSADVKKLCEAQTANEQREIWPRIRRVLMSRPVYWAVVGTEWFTWKAAGVPPSQRNMIVTDFLERSGLAGGARKDSEVSGQAIWEYVVNTLDPVVKDTLISNDNYFYYLCLQGRYSRRCHPNYLTPRAHMKLSAPNAFDGLRIHTDEINEVVSRITPGTLTIAVIMDSMDWFDPSKEDASKQARALNHSLKMGGRILLRSASIKPWYIKNFEENGFTTQRLGARFPGSCIDRVNMYASTWICKKTAEITPANGDASTTSPLTLERINSSSSVDDLEI